MVKLKHGGDYDIMAWELWRHEGQSQQVLQQACVTILRAAYQDDCYTKEFIIWQLAGLFVVQIINIAPDEEIRPQVRGETSHPNIQYSLAYCPTGINSRHLMNTAHMTSIFQGESFSLWNVWDVHRGVILWQFVVERAFRALLTRIYKKQNLCRGCTFPHMFSFLD